MDTSSTTPQPLPRLRVLRTSPSGRRDNGNASVASSQAGPSRLTDFTQLVDLNLSDMHPTHAYTDEDEDEDQYPTPRMNPTASLSPSSAIPTPSLAGRLRELIHLVPNGSTSQNTSTLPRPPSPTFHESDFEGESTAAGHSRARESLRDIFSKALREPGDTPQKGKQKRHPDDSSSDIDRSPRNSQNRSDLKGKGKNYSDEESVNSMNFDNRSSYLPGSVQHTILRTSRDSSAIDFPLKSISAEDSDDADDHPHYRRTSPPDTSNAPLQSLRISQNSSVPHHSNLLDQDSEMQRAFGELDSSDAASSNSHEPHEAYARENPETNLPPISPEQPENVKTPYAQGRSRRSLDSNTPSLSNQTVSTVRPTTRHLNHDVVSNGRNGGQRRTSLNGSTTPGLKHKTSASFQFSDQSSGMSVSDYGDRMKEMERERNREREREWNKPHPSRARPVNSHSIGSSHPELRSRTSSISSMESPRPGSALSNVSVDSESPRVRVRTSSGLSERPRTISGGNRPSSALSTESASVADFPQGLRRHRSLISRADSPMSSQGSQNQFESTRFEVDHERERNWNAPRPIWHRRSLPNTPDRPPSPGASKSSSHSPANSRRQSTTPSTTPKDTSNTTRSSSSLGQRHLQTKAISPSPTPAERRHTVSHNGKSPHSSRLPPAAGSTSTRSQSPLPGQTSRQSRLPVPSPRINGSRLSETPKPIPNSHVRDEVEEMPSKLTASHPQIANGQSLSQVSMDLTEAYNGRETSSALPSFSDYSHSVATPNNDTMHTASLLGPTESQSAIFESQDEDEENPLAQQTPKLQTIDQLQEESELRDAQEFSSASAQEDLISSYQDLETAPPDLRPLEANQSSSMPSFLSTPPRSRQSSFNNSKLEFHTPPPPKGLPDLPGPPPASGDETEEDEFLPQFKIKPTAAATPTMAKNGDGRGDITTFKTPKPPGAWFATPGPSSNTTRHRDDSTPSFVDSSDDGLINPKPQSVYPQTPAPPGGWAYTPAPQRTHSSPKSVVNEGGLSTPVGSLGRSNAPVTPGFGSASKKSILKVRFDPDVTGPTNVSSDLSENMADKTNGSSPGYQVSNGAVRSITPEPVTPTTPPSRSPLKHKRSPKSPSVRIVDAYGNEQKQNNREPSSPTPATPRNRSGIRIVDALGHELNEEQELHKQDTMDAVDLDQISPMSRVETIQRVRQGIQELAEGLESLDLTSQNWVDDSARLKELSETSQALKQSREQLAQDMHKAEKQLRRQVRQKVNAASFLGRNAWFLLFVGVAQLVLIFIMYRASVLRARQMFLTNYYDPFNPDLFLYTTNPDTQYARPITSWNLVTQAIRHRDMPAFTGAFRDNLSIIIKRLHQRVWDVWGDDPNRPVGTWPPT